MIFVNISTISPPLELYPASQRVTFLYYLGRFNFSNHHYYRAALCLQEAYLQTPPRFASHRTAILVYLIPSNLILGRLPSASLLRRPEAHPMAPVFQPLCQALRSGDFLLFQSHLAAYEAWLLDAGLLLALAYRLRPLLWRALSRRVFLLTYVAPSDASSRKAATLDLSDLHAAAVYAQRRIEGWLPAGGGSSHQSPRARTPHGVNALLIKAVTNSASAAETTLLPPPGGPRRLRPNEGIIWGNAPVTHDDVEMAVANLIQQGLVHGFVAHGQGRFAIIGAKSKGSPVVAGWPNVWQTVRDRRYDDDFDLDDVPGWKR